MENKNKEFLHDLNEDDEFNLLHSDDLPDDNDDFGGQDEDNYGDMDGEEDDYEDMDNGDEQFDEPIPTVKLDEKKPKKILTPNDCMEKVYNMTILTIDKLSRAGINSISYDRTFGYKLNRDIYLFLKDDNSKKDAILKQNDKQRNYKLKYVDLCLDINFNFDEIDKYGSVVKPAWLESKSIVIVFSLEHISKRSYAFELLVSAIKDKKMGDIELKDIFFLIPTDRETIEYLKERIGGRGMLVVDFSQE